LVSPNKYLKDYEGLDAGRKKHLGWRRMLSIALIAEQNEWQS